MTTTPRVLAAATIGLMLAGLLAGCGDDAAAEPSLPSTVPSASPSPSLSEAEQIEQQNVDDATAMLTEFYAADSRLANDGFEGAADLRAFWSDLDGWESLKATYDQAKKQGYRTEGAATIVSTDVTEYTPDPTDAGFETVRLTVCVDRSDVTTFDGDGNQLDPAGAERFEAQYAMQHQGEGASWTITEFTPTETSC